MSGADFSSIPRDSEGRYRSSKLPAMRGEFISLPAKIDEPGNAGVWQERLADPQSLIVLDLFSGAGGMSLGFADAGFFIAAAVDRQPWAAMSHAYNFLSKTVVCDVREITDPLVFVEELGLPRVDVVIGGPPCQGFARVGRGKLRSVNLEEHYRTVLNDLYIDFVRFVEKLQPLAFVMENVPDMLTYQDGELFTRLEEGFDGYTVDHRILEAVHFGVPQRRNRLFLQGNRLGLPVRWPVPEAVAKFVSVREAISDLPVRLPPSLDEILPYTAQELTPYQASMRQGMSDDQRNVVFDHIIRQVRQDDYVIFGLLEEGQKYSDLPDEWRRYRSDIFDDKYRKLIYDQPSWTVTAHIRKDAYRYIHPDPAQRRTLSIREFARLQSFPDQFRFCGPRTERMWQIGNAVPPLLARSIASKLEAQLREWQDLQSVNESRSKVLTDAAD